jgi:hypothetical protein
LELSRRTANRGGEARGGDEKSFEGHGRVGRVDS